MKPFHILGVLVLSLLGGFIGAKLATPSGATAPQAAPVTGPVAAVEAVAAPDKGVATRLDALDMQLALLQRKIEDAAGSASSRSEAPEAVAAQVEAAVANAAPSRDTILRVIEEDRLMQEQKRETERKEREALQAKQRAERTAQRLGMDALQTQTLADFYVSERAKFDELRQGWQNGGDPEGMREQMRVAREWRDAELNRLFGPTLGPQLAEQGFEGMGRGNRGNNNNNNNTGGGGGGGGGNRRGGGAGGGGNGNGGGNANGGGNGAGGF
ncbi:MAG: hypothetical protein RIR65_389 [Planctomycetota bacterium]